MQKQIEILGHVYFFDIDIQKNIGKVIRDSVAMDSFNIFDENNKFIDPSEFEISLIYNKGEFIKSIANITPISISESEANDYILNAFISSFTKIENKKAEKLNLIYSIESNGYTPIAKITLPNMKIDRMFGRIFNATIKKVVITKGARIGNIAEVARLIINDGTGFIEIGGIWNNFGSREIFAEIERGTIRGKIIEIKSLESKTDEWSVFPIVASPIRMAQYAFTSKDISFTIRQVKISEIPRIKEVVISTEGVISQIQSPEKLSADTLGNDLTRQVMTIIDPITKDGIQCEIWNREFPMSIKIGDYITIMGCLVKRPTVTSYLPDDLSSYRIEIINATEIIR